MQIRKDGIYKNIDSKDFGIFQKSGWEKVVAEDVVVVKKEEVVEEPIVEELPVEEKIEEPVEELPKSKKKKK